MQSLRTSRIRSIQPVFRPSCLKVNPMGCLTASGQLFSGVIRSYARERALIQVGSNIGRIYSMHSAFGTLRPTMKTFENKTVLITGGASGIGKATAIAFGKEGANVVVSGRRVAEGEQVAREITSAGGSALYVQADVGREDDIVALVEKTVGAFGALHVAFNNAGTEGQFGLLITEQTVEHYHQVCDVNIRGVLLLMKHEIPVMLRSGGGAIVNNSSAAGHIGFPGASAYVASKFAVIGLTKTAALEFATQGIRVNSVSPGTIQTEMFDRAFGEGETEMKRTMAAQNPVGRIGKPEEIASAVLWLSFTRCGLHHGPGHYRRRRLHRTIAGNNDCVNIVAHGSACAPPC